MNQETLRPKIGVGCLIIRDRKVLLGARKGAHGASSFAWTGGHLEFGETLEQCVERKVYEESGLVVNKLKFLCMSNIIYYGKHYLDIEFLAEDTIGEPKNLKATIDNWGWYDLDNLPNNLFRPCELAILSYKTGNFYNP